MFATDARSHSIPIHLVHEDEFNAWAAALDEPERRWLTNNQFKGERCKTLLIPAADGNVKAAVVGLGKRSGSDHVTLWHSSGLPDRLPAGDYHLATALSMHAATQFTLGWAYGQYRYERYRRPMAARAVRLHVPEGVDRGEVEQINAACTSARDLINTPANDMSPEALAAAAIDVAQRFSCTVRQYVGDELLAKGLPAIHAVGRASHSAPRLVDFERGDARWPRVTLVGKGVCFDSGGLDIKTSASMLLMKKDMGGAAMALALAQLLLAANLPIRLRVILPIVENAIAGNAFRPGDVLATRKGLSVEVGNTDAEGRLILCDALTLADAAQPDLLIDMATLTGAARVALGPELPALFSTDETLAQDLQRTAHAHADPMWLMPLWGGYDDELGSKIADLNNVSSSGFSGAIIGALFLKRFIAEARAWMHVDLYAWNGKERPGRPVGAEPQCVRALYAFLRSRYGA